MRFLLSKLPSGGKRTLYALALVFCAQSLFAQTTYLSGTVSDGTDPLIGASVKALRGTDLIRGAITDYDGNFRLALDPGVYSLEVAYTGTQPQRVDSIVVLAGKINVIPKITLITTNSLSEVVITSYKVSLIEQDKTSSGSVMSSSDISRLPNRNSARDAEKQADRTKVKRSKPTASTPPPAAIKSTAPAILYQQPQPESPHPGKPANSMGDTTRRDQYSAEQYNSIVENPFQDAKSGNISTFSIDVDAASYTNVRRYLNSHIMPPPDAVRIEEMINYFDYQYQAPAGEHPFEANVEVAPCPWNPANRLMVIGMQGTNVDLEQLPSSNFVFLIDVSGSMGEETKLPLVQQSLSLLTDRLRANDKVAIVVYAGAAGLVLESTPGTEKAKIKEAIQKLQSGGSTAGGAGIKLAYDTAIKNFATGGNNRVILCTDGDFNVGVSSEDELVKLIEKERESGVYLTVLGFGMGNYQDGKMQQLADKGNGNHAYIDQLSEAKKVLIQEFGGTLFAIAKDVKLQLHFNPEIVAGYRLIGYENRLLATEDFHDDTKDAGELGAGHRVTALYELVPKGQTLPVLGKLDSALVVVQKPDNSVKIKPDDLMVLQLRYKKPKGSAPSKLMEYHLNAAAMDRKTESDNFKLAAAVAEFGLLLRDSKYKGAATYTHALARIREASTNDPNGYRTELAALVETAGRLSAKLK